MEGPVLAPQKRSAMVAPDRDPHNTGLPRLSYRLGCQSPGALAEGLTCTNALLGDEACSPAQLESHCFGAPDRHHHVGTLLELMDTM